MLEKNSLHTPYLPLPYADKLVRETHTQFTNPEGLKHFLALPATVNDIVSYLKKEGLLLRGPIQGSSRNDLPALSSYFCKWKHDVSSLGIDTDPLLAMIKSLSEGLERSLMWEVGTNLNTIYSKVPKNVRVVNPFEEQSYFKEQLLGNPTLGIKVDTHSAYVNFSNILTNETVALPAEYVFRGMARYIKTPISSTTNGGGAHIKKEDALLSAIHEYIERDAFLVHWLCKITPIQLHLNSIKKTETKDLLKEAVARGLDIHLLVLDSHVGLPTFICCIFDKRKNPITFVVAGGTDAFDYEKAIYRSITESFSVLQEVLDKSEMPEFKGTIPFINSRMGRERILFWRGDWILKELHWLTSGKRMNLEEVKKWMPELRTLKKGNGKLLATHMGKYLSGLEVFCFEVKSMYATRIGLHVTKVYVPQLLHFYLYEHLANVNTKRLWDIMNKKDGELFTVLNPLPHPFP